MSTMDPCLEARGRRSREDAELSNACMASSESVPRVAPEFNGSDAITLKKTGMVQRNNLGNADHGVTVKTKYEHK